MDKADLSRVERGLLPLNGDRLKRLASFYKVTPKTLAKEHGFKFHSEARTSLSTSSPSNSGGAAA